MTTTLIRTLNATATRRRIMRGLAGATAGTAMAGLIAQGASADAEKDRGEKCQHSHQCQSECCAIKDGEVRCRSKRYCKKHPGRKVD